MAQKERSFTERRHCSLGTESPLASACFFLSHLAIYHPRGEKKESSSRFHKAPILEHSPRGFFLSLYQKSMRFPDSAHFLSVTRFDSSTFHRKFSKSTWRATLFRSYQEHTICSHLLNLPPFNQYQTSIPAFLFAKLSEIGEKSNSHIVLSTTLVRY